MESTLPNARQRIFSIDILRGIIMCIMALDHVRDFYSNVNYDPLDLTKTSAALFFTRWITHFCAPTFVFLAGTSAFLSLSKKNDKSAASLFLLKRGIWLVVLEFSIITFGWQLDPGFHVLFAQVIWAIGCSMIVLSALVFLRPVYVGVIGLVLIFGHNAFDHVKADSFGQYKLLWMILHKQSFYAFNNRSAIFILYPLVPWVGVMAVGYAFGTLFKLDAAVRRSLFIKIGLSCLVLFIALRFSNLYGDPFPWQIQDSWWKDILAFIKCYKYPPSLLYLLMTLGISILALAGLEGINNRVTNFFLVYGRVPMFYYIPHLYIIHLSQVFVALASGFTVQQLQKGALGKPGAWGFSLPVVYFIWLAVVLILYFPCRWFMGVKQRRRNWWLSYI